MTTESKKSPAPEQASEAVPQRPRTENPTAEAIFEQAAGAGNLISSKSGDGKSREDALTDDQRQALGESISEYFGKLDSDEGIRAPEGRILRAFDYCDSRNVDDLIDRAIVPALAASPVEQPAAAPAVVTELASMTRMFHAACHDLGLINEALGLDPDDGGAAPILDAIAELKGRATSANETGAEGATDLRERARLAADQWANPGTSIPQRTAYRDGFIDGASSPAIAAQAVAAWLHRDDPRDCISDAKKRDMIEHAGSGGRRLAENYSIGLCRLDALPAMAAAAPLARKTRNPHRGGTQAYLATEHFNEGWNACLDEIAAYNECVVAEDTAAAQPAAAPADERAAFEAWYERTCPISAEALRIGACDESIQESRDEMALGFSAGVAYARAAASPAASIPDGYTLVPKRITAAMIESAMEHHYGKRRARQNGGAGGIVMTVNDTDWSGIDAMRRLWKGALAAAPQPAQADAPAQAREPHTYASTQATNCAQCGEHKHTPLRIDWMGGYVCLTCIDREFESRAPADAGEPIGQHDLSTSTGGRAYIAEFFAKRLRRHDFGRYIAERLAADFACALAQYLSEHDAASRTEPCVELPRFPTMLRKMWSGGEVQRWIDENVALRDALDHIARVARGSREQSRRQRWIELRALGALNGTDEWRTLPLPKNGDGVRRRLVHRISELEAEVERLNAMIAAHPDQPETRVDVTDDKQDKAKGLIKTLSDIIHDQTVAMQSAIIEWRHGNGAEAGLSWIVNTLEGPGHFPDFDAPHGKHAQFWFNANQANPLPACFCGNPSSSLWMGQGFCCDEHYRAAKAKHDAARAGGQS
ncbi:hypothetical protein WK55_31305 [Burkholderia ubonensis]|uniref:hypothetical protein n=1 Tax=Burkholderia ubonensis TaxID=101571 RepID=UPI000756EF17|nr:hypothetical protein [Burkholderia ubonensis]KVT65644.1 hypothetical protein WK55_31305 [Burkholderia ubonensis]